MNQLWLRGGLEARICTGMGRPVPLPPHALQRIMPEPSQVLHPTSSSDHRVHMHGTLRLPLQVGHWLKPPMDVLSCSASMMDLITHAPASALNPCTTCCTTGDITPATTDSPTLIHECDQYSYSPGSLNNQSDTALPSNRSTQQCPALLISQQGTK